MSFVVKDGSEYIEQQRKKAQEEYLNSEEVLLATNVLELARGVIVADNQFLASPMGQLQMIPAELKDKVMFASAGNTLYFDPVEVLTDFAKTEDAPVHNLLHVLMHFILLHPFVGKDISPEAWSLACDISVESLTCEVLGKRKGWRGEAEDEVLNQLTEDFEGKLTAERLYRKLKEGAYAEHIDDWSVLFEVDNHEGWYPQESTEDQEQSSSSQPKPSQDQEQSSMSEQDVKDKAGESRPATPEEMEDNQDGSGESKPANTQSEAPKMKFSPEQLEDMKDKWKKASKSMKVDLETLSKKRGDRMGGLMRELEVTQHEEIDFKEFLRQFMVKNNDMRLSDDEFDYIFYTYGLNLYGNMPLIEPLEYRSNKRVRDFCIVIDTSSSVTSTVVQKFIDATYDVLVSENTFAEKVNIHIIMCDATVRSDTKITSINELDRWRKNIKLRGFGGTDFRPAFRYINELYHSGEFDDLGGVLYFTDGWGIYPDRIPPYKTAFCFYDEDHRPELVPPWAIQLTLNPGQFESMSIY